MNLQNYFTAENTSGYCDKDIETMNHMLEQEMGEYNTYNLDYTDELQNVVEKLLEVFV